MKAALLGVVLVFLPVSHELKLLLPAKDQVERLDVEASTEEPGQGGAGGSAGVSMTAVLRRTIRAVEAGRATRERFVVRELEATAVALADDGSFVSEKELLDVPAVFLVTRPDDDQPADWLGLCLRADWDALLRAVVTTDEVESGDTWEVSPRALLSVLGPRGADLAAGSWARATLAAARATKVVEVDAVLRFETRRGAGRLRVRGRIEGAFDGEAMPSLSLDVHAHRPDGSHERRSVAIARALETDD